MNKMKKIAIATSIISTIGAIAAILTFVVAFSLKPIVIETETPGDAIGAAFGMPFVVATVYVMSIFVIIADVVFSFTPSLISVILLGNSIREAEGGLKIYAIIDLVFSSMVLVASIAGIIFVILGLANITGVQPSSSVASIS